MDNAHISLTHNGDVYLSRIDSKSYGVRSSNDDFAGILECRNDGGWRIELRYLGQQIVDESNNSPEAFNYSVNTLRALIAKTNELGSFEKASSWYFDEMKPEFLNWKKQIESEFSKALECEKEYLTSFGGRSISYTIKLGSKEKNEVWVKLHKTDWDTSEPKLKIEFPSSNAIEAYKIWKENRVNTINGLIYAPYLINGEFLDGSEDQRMKFGYQIYPDDLPLNEVLEACYRYLDGKFTLANFNSIGKFKLGEPFSYEPIGQPIRSSIDKTQRILEIQQEFDSAPDNPFLINSYAKFISSFLSEENYELRALIDVFGKVNSVFWVRKINDERIKNNRYMQALIEVGSAYQKFLNLVRHEKDNARGRKIISSAKKGGAKQKPEIIEIYNRIVERISKGASANNAAEQVFKIDKLGTSASANRQIYYRYKKKL